MLKFAVAQVLSAHTGRDGLSRTAHRADFSHHEVRPGYLYVRNRAISSRTNDNHDTFPAEELEKAWKTFIGRPVFVNHSNDNHRRARGVVIDAALHTDTAPDGSPDTWIEVLMEIDGVRFPKLAKAILAGEIDKTSMGTDVDESECSACGNKATNPAMYCKHIPGQKGLKFQKRSANGDIQNVLIHEICRGLRFFENSLLVEAPADPTANLLGVDATGLNTTAAKTAHTMDDGARLDALADHMGSHHLVGPEALERWRNTNGPMNLDFHHKQHHHSGSFNEDYGDHPDLWHQHDPDDHVAWPGIENEWESGGDASGMGATAVRRTAMPSELYSRPEGFHTTTTDSRAQPPEGAPLHNPACDESSHSTSTRNTHWMDGYDPASTIHPDPVSTLEYSAHPCGKHVYVHHLGTPPDQRSKGYASALMDDLYKAYPHAVIDHGQRSSDGKGWWGTYDDPAPDRSISDATRYAAAVTARYSDTGPHCTRCHHLAGTGPACPKCDATKTLKAAIGDLDLDGDGHAMTWQYRDAGLTLHGTCGNCARTTELGTPGMRGDNTGQPRSAHSGPCPAGPAYHRPDTADRLPHAVDHLPEPILPQHLNAATTAGTAADNDWDAIHPGIGDIHRGINVFLHPEDHDIVHDKTLPPHQRAAHLMGSFSRSLSGRYHGADEGHFGRHWTTDPAIAEESADNGSRVYQHQRVATAVLFHAHKPNREDIEQNPDHNIIYDYGHREKEVPLREGAPVHLKGISWKSLEDEFDGEGHTDIDPDYTHHDFGHPGHHVTAARPTLTSVFAALATTASEDTYDNEEDDDYDSDLPGHTTCDRGHRHWGEDGAAGLLIVHHHPTKGPQCLLGKRADWVQHPGTWGIPGGAMHDGEDPEDAAMREGGEELGRLPHLTHIHTHTDDHGGWAYHTHIMRAEHPFKPRGGDTENDHFGWYTPHEFKNLDLHPGFAASWPQIAPHTRKTGARRTAAAHNWWDAYSPQAPLRNTEAMASDDPDYTQGRHRAPGAEGAPLHNPGRDGHYPEMPLHTPADPELAATMAKAEGNPRARVRIYRAVPPGVTGINKGDWITPSFAYAKAHTDVHAMGSGRPGHVLRATVDARHVHTDGVDLREWSYHGPDAKTVVHWKPPQLAYHPDYAGGAANLSPEDHDFVHDPTRPTADRAHRLMSAIPRYSTSDKGPYVAAALHQNKGGFTGNRSDAHIDAQDNADSLEPGPRPATLFMLHSPQNSQPITGVSFAQHTPPETPMSAYTHHTWGPDEVDEDTGMRRQASAPTGGPKPPGWFSDRMDALSGHMAERHGNSPEELRDWRPMPGELDHRHQKSHDRLDRYDHSDRPELLHRHHEGEAIAWPGIEGDWEHGDDATGARLASLTVQAMPPRHENPADHPFFKAHPVSAAHVVAHWAKASDEEKNQGMRWYADAHLLAKALGDTYAGGDTGKAAGVLSAYSPRSAWPANMHNAARSLASGKALDVGEGMSIMGIHHTLAKKILEGHDYDDVLKGPKTNAFAKLIHHGGTDPHTGRPQPHVVIDRHALSVAAGKRLTEKEAGGFPSSNTHYYNHAAKAYTDAADAISKTEGHTVAPHQVQATTWLVRKRLNRDEDLAAKGGGGRGRAKMQDGTQTGWNATHPDLLPGGLGDNMHLGRREAARRRLGNMERTPEEWAEHRRRRDEAGAELGKQLWDGMLNAGGFADTEHARAHRQNNDAMSLQDRFSGDEADGEHGHDANGEPYYQIRHPHGWLGRTYDGPRLHISHESDPESEIDSPMVDGAKSDFHSSGSSLPHGFGHHDLHRELHEWAMLSGPDYARNYGHGHPEGHDTPSERQTERMQGLWDKHAHDKGGRLDYDESGEPYFETAHHPVTGFTARDTGRHVEISHTATPEEVHDTPDGPNGEPLHKTKDMHTPGLYKARDEWSDAHAKEFTKADSDITRWRQHRERNASLRAQAGAGDDHHDGKSWGLRDAPLPSEAPPLHHLDGEHGFPSDVYSHPEYYGHDESAHRTIRKARGNPDALIDVYHPVHKNVSSIGTGSLVTVNPGEAYDYCRYQLGENHHVLHAVVPARHLFADMGNADLKYYGYHGPTVHRLKPWTGHHLDDNQWRDLGAEDDFKRALPGTHTEPFTPLPHSLNVKKTAVAGDDDYKMQHQAPDSDYGAPLHEPTRGFFPDDVYEHPDWYTGSPDGEMLHSLHRARNEPDKKIRIYRAVPPGIKHIHPGNWVTLSKEYAKGHAQDLEGPGRHGHVLSIMTPARHIITDGNDLQEWAYHGPTSMEGLPVWKPPRPRKPKTAYGETKAPADVDTLRSDSCEVCGNSEGWDGMSCPVCQYTKPPDIFRDPDTSVARDMDLRGLGDQAADTAMTQGADAVPGGLDQTQQLPGGEALDGQGAPGSEPAGGEVEDPNDATADGEVRTLSDGEPQDGAQDVDPDAVSADTADPQGPGAPLPGGPEGAADPGMEDPDPEAAIDGVDADVLTCPACGYQTQAGAPVSTVTADPAAPASAGPVAGDVCPECQQAVLVSQAEMEGEAAPPEVPAEDPEAVEDPEATEPQAPKPKSPAVKRVSTRTNGGGRHP